MSQPDCDTHVMPHLRLWMNQMKKTLAHLFKEEGFNHNDFHMGNVMIENSTSRPVIIDFDWSTFDLNDSVAFQNAKGLYERYVAMQSAWNRQHLELGTITNARPFTTIVPCNEKKQLWWYIIHKSYSVFGKHDRPNLTSFVAKIDMGMLLNHIFVFACDNNIDIAPALSLTPNNIDSFIDLVAPFLLPN